MDIINRVMVCRVLLQTEQNHDYSNVLGIRDVSHFREGRYRANHTSDVVDTRSINKEMIH